MTPFVYAEEGISQTDDIVSVRTVDKDVLMSVTQNSPYSVKELSEKLDLGTVLPGQSVNVTTTDIDATDLSNWYGKRRWDIIRIFVRSMGTLSILRFPIIVIQWMK